MQGRRERRKDVTRAELLLAARKLFSRKGLYECRVDEITERADLGKGTLYQYFRSKEELIGAVVSAGFEDLGRFVDERTRGARTVEDVVEAVVRSHLDFFADNPDLLRIFHQVRGLLKFNRPEWRPLRGILQGHLDRLSRMLEQAGAGIPIGASRAGELAGVLFGGVSGWLSVRVATSPGARARPVPEGLVEALVALAIRFASEERASAARRDGRPGHGAAASPRGVRG